MESLDTEILAFKEAFCPYGYLDIEFAVKEAINAGHDGDWAFGQVETFCEDCEAKVKDVDPCYVVMDAILQNARNEIDELCGFDICNDVNFFVYGNFMASAYNADHGDLEKLKSALSEFEDKIPLFSDCTLYYLNEIGIELNQTGKNNDN